MLIKTDEPPKRCSKCPRYEPVFRDNSYCGFFCNSIPNGIQCTIDGNTGRLKQCPMIVGRAISPDGPRPKKEDIMGDGHIVYRKSNKYYKNKERLNGRSEEKHYRKETDDKEGQKAFNPRSS